MKELENKIKSLEDLLYKNEMDWNSRKNKDMSLTGYIHYMDVRNMTEIRIEEAKAELEALKNQG